MDSLPFEALLELAAGWHPPSGEFELSRSYWQTWEQFLATWVAVRDEYMAHQVWGVNDGPDGNFAEKVYKTFGAKGPPAHYGYDEIRAAFAAAEDENVAELLRDVRVNGNNY